jgi:hypothetical protein
MRTLLVADAIDDGDALWVAGELTVEDEDSEVLLLPAEWIAGQDPAAAINEALKLFDAQRVLVASYSRAAADRITHALTRSPIPAGRVVVEPRNAALQAA